MKWRVLFCIISLLVIYDAQCQTDFEINALKKINISGQSKSPNTFKSYKGLSGYLLRFYKKYISSQDVSHCAFAPSCSEYAVEAIHKKGIFTGILAAFDRLSRCNSFLGEPYLFDPVQAIYSDPFPF